MEILIVPVEDGSIKDSKIESVEVVNPSKIIYLQDIKDEFLIPEDKQGVKDIGSERVNLGDIWESSFEVINNVTSNYDDSKSNFFIDVSLVKGDFRAAMIVAAFTKGIKVFTRQNDELILLPIYKFTYYRELTDKKKEILELLFEAEGQEMGLETLSEKTNMSLPLISYHINGNQKSEGLKELGLVTSREEKGRSYIHLTSMGRMLLKGHVKHEPENK
ncbi:hypothetical protein C0585_04705 [Candidatus Woesearchaeota archaeon]|mgnify:CR=1 FL=1|nr:MAG: hypothetical protein C0585_04705 [Candidatus Woesearchaeota archaeon]